MQELAKCSRGTPRIANRLLKRVRDYADYENLDVINLNIAKKALKLMDIDELGLDAVDRNVLETAIKNSTAARSVLIRYRRRLARMQPPSKTLWSRSLFNSVLSRARRAVAPYCRLPMSIWALNT